MTAYLGSSINVGTTDKTIMKGFGSFFNKLEDAGGIDDEWRVQACR